ncbi:MAG: hypothetical protein OEN50_05985 [Deltaproteobacteria bacterium]|nr:hypothetical protein [Deltaproteobacteria bacterium]
MNVTTSSSTPTGTYPVTVRGSAGALAKTTIFDLSVTAATSGNPASGITLIREAENGSLTPPMTIRSDGTASGGKYVEVPLGSGNNYTDSTNGGPGQVNFAINITKAGTYALWARTIAASSTSDSFYVTKNGSRIAEWFVPHSTSWLWNKVADTYLGAGNVNLAFRQREDGTKLDEIILTNDSNYVPAGFPQSTPPPSTYSLDVNVVKLLTNNGYGNGSVTSSPGGINCGNDCSESYNSGTVVNLIASPASGSTFVGWSGHADCSDGVVTMNSNIACNATFSSQGSALSVNKSGNGSGTVTSAPSGINCGSDCSETYASGTSVTLTAVASAGSVFTGWSGGGCGQSTNCTLTVSGGTTVTANFNTTNNGTGPDKIGIYSPATGEFFLDRNGNGRWDGCSVDLCYNWLAQNSGIPVAGDWDGTGTIRIGTFRLDTAQWFLDRNGNGRWDGCSVDICSSSVGVPGDYPVVRYNKNSKRHNIGVFRSAVFSNNTLVNRGVWNVDVNGNYDFEGAVIDSYVSQFGWQNNFPVVGDWGGNGTYELGLFDSIYSFWMLDSNGNEVWDGCNVELCFSPFGQSNDLPVAGDWDGAGNSKIGTFSPSSGQWFLDKNGNGQLDSCSVDSCYNSFSQGGYLPVIGKW